MKAPIPKRGPYLITTRQSGLTDTERLELQEAWVEQVERFRARGAIVGVTTQDVTDSFATRTLRSLARPLLLCIRPEVASATVAPGLDSMRSLGQSARAPEEALPVPGWRRAGIERHV
jgi:rsbT antagonist protein RsbS